MTTSIIPANFYTPGNVHDILYAIALLIFVAIEVRFSPLRKLARSTGDFFGHPYPRIWALSMPFVIWFWLSLLFFVHYDANILVLRVFDIGGTLGTGHWFIWLMFAALVTRYGWDNIIQGGIVIGLVAAMHEITWYVFYYIVYPAESSLAFVFYLPFIFLCCAFVVAYFVLAYPWSVTIRTRIIKGPCSIVRIPTNTLVTVMAVIVVFDALWALAGFPVTIDLVTGGTSLYLSLLDNMVENASWVIPCLILLVAPRYTLINRKRTGALK